MAKYWIAEMLNRVVERGVQFHGGYGYMEEYPIARLFRDARVYTPSLPGLRKSCCSSSVVIWGCDQPGIMKNGFALEDL
jgi:hypothetical protein